MIISCGEALIDMLPRTTDQGELLFAPVAGGAVFNTAKALGRLGVSSGYFGCLSDDAFGQLLEKALHEANVSTDLCTRSELPTALAMVSLQEGAASYSFHFSDTAGLSLSADSLPAMPEGVSGLHFGGISLLAEPCGSAYEALLLRESSQRLVSLDPNIRPDFVTDELAFRARIERMLSHSHIIKVSDEDLEWLRPNQEVADVAEEWLAGGAHLVVVTRGASGASVYCHDFTTEVPAVLAERVVDTVGAGDTFVAGLWAGLSAAGLLSKASLAVADQAAIEQAVVYAQRAASLSVTRAGADSPWLHEMSE
ncbi:MAG: carbohydrate kinase family protein [Granulosicoccaceae bacterium]